VKWVLCVAVAAAAGRGAILSQNWHESKLTLEFDDGYAEIEWLTPAAFRVARSFGEPLAKPGNIAHYPVLAALEDAGADRRMRTRLLTVQMDAAGSTVSVRSREEEVARIALTRSTAGVQVSFGPSREFFGLRGGTDGGLNLAGRKLERNNGLLLTGNGYGLLMRYPQQARFDLAEGAAQASGRAVDFAFYYGPSPKEIFEQHQTVTGRVELKGATLPVLSPAALQPEAAPLRANIADWASFAALVRWLNHWSLSAVLYPAFDLAAVNSAGAELKQRVLDLAAILPLIFRSEGQATVNARQRQSLGPYFLTYFREAYERGFPLIHPFPLQFPRDSGMDRHDDQFMLGDELLIAPVLSPGNRRAVDLPRGIWTDLRTNIEYRGNQSAGIDAPPGRVPMFARNGSLFPLAVTGKTELHYFPSLGGEFFLWEPDQADYSQFHAAPAGDFLRVEIESKATRTYEWILHHTRVPREVVESSEAYQRAPAREKLAPGAWWHDAQNNNLHVMLRAEAGSDRIVNIAF
jgi:hypothetical protein